MNLEINKYTEPLGENLTTSFREIQRNFMDMIASKEESLIKEALRAHLKREPTLSDAKLCSRVYDQREFPFGGYILCYKDLKIASINTSYSQSDNLCVGEMKVTLIN